MPSNQPNIGSVRGRLMVYYTVWCGCSSCGCVDWEYAEGHQFSDATASATSIGWAYRPSRGGWLCPDCRGEAVGRLEEDVVEIDESGNIGPVPETSMPDRNHLDTILERAAQERGAPPAKGVSRD